jgi:hypothetical protein
MGEWRYSSAILYLGSGWRCMVSFTPRPLYLQGNSPLYPLSRRLAGPPSRSGRYEEEKNFLRPSRIELLLLGRPVRSLVTIPTALSKSQVGNSLYLYKLHCYWEVCVKLSFFVFLSLPPSFSYFFYSCSSGNSVLYSICSYLPSGLILYHSW